jgi:carbonic anhydrase
MLLLLACTAGLDSTTKESGGETGTEEEEIHWGYEDTEHTVGSERWAEHWPDCGNTSQSPIDLNDTIFSSGTRLDLSFDYQTTTLKILNNGHTLQWLIDPGSGITLDGVRYELVQFHLHAQSEHTNAGEHLPLELHLVHQAADESLAVLGLVFTTDTSDNPVFSEIGWGNFPTETDQEISDPSISYNPSSLLPGDFASNLSMIRYSGSLTTPPCTEGVNWMVAAYASLISDSQLSAFTALFDGNFRPAQELNGREVSFYIAEEE